MRRFRSLVWVNLKVGLDAFFSGMSFLGRKKKAGLFSKFGYGAKLLFFALIFTPMIFSVGYMAYRTMALLAPLRLDPALVSAIQVGGMVLILLTAVVAVPSVYYFSGDLDHYLSMPLRPREILAAKFLTVVIEQYYLLVLMIVPMAVGFLMIRFSVTSLLGWLISIVFLPVFPVLLVSILILLLMNLAPVLRDKDRMAMITGLFSLIFAFGLAILFQMRGDQSGTQLANIIMRGEGLFTSVAQVFPPLRGAQLMISGTQAGDFLLGLGITVASNAVLVFIYLILSERLYFKGALGMGESRSRGRTLNAGQREKAISRTSSLTRTLFLREHREILRTPVYFLNGVLSALLVPVIMIVAVVVSLRFNAEVELSEMTRFFSFLTELLADSQTQIIAGLIAGGAIALFSGGMNSLSATAVSRDARCLETLKSLPVSARRIFFVKLLPGWIYGMVTLVLFPAVLMMAIPIPPMTIAVYFISGAVMTYAINLFDLIIDIKRPKLNWQDETKAMKGNMNTMIAQFLGMGLIALVIVGGLLLPLAFAQYIYLTAGIFLLLTLLLTLLLSKRADRWLGALNRA
ncbi:MAG: hypothetical protein SOR89_02155 [Ndongobacter sp.]|nr:hypothetical protein [Ndongobacter sp.]